MSAPKQPVVFIIRDGWGINPDGLEKAEENGDATLLAQTPFHDHLYQTYPLHCLSASGLDVGLPEGQMGNSEVGHLNLGAGRIVYQDFTRINKAIDEQELGSNAALTEAFTQAKSTRLHLIGLVSDGGVHSHQNHLVALAQAAHQAGVKDIMVHAITDGRDTSPTRGKDYLHDCELALAEAKARISTVVGRYFAMDRDNRWDRTQVAWDAIVHGQGEPREMLASEAVEQCYSQLNKTDEFLPAMVFGHVEEERVRDGDVILFFNFRADRARQLSQAFLQEDFVGFERGGRPKTHYLTLTEYDETYGVPVVFPPVELKDVLGEVVGRAGLKQLRIAETEKYPHVTYFFNGGKEVAFPGEEREIIPSPKVATYDLQPEMSADQVTETITRQLADYDLVILNFANPDMVGHTGDISAAVQAVEKIDWGVQQVVEKTLALGGRLVISADHGNCEQMNQKSDGSPHTAHTTNLVHLLYVGADHAEYELREGILADIAPTLLFLLGLEKPDRMTGKSLLTRKSS
ncbi:MAG: 2,3-bisphosphoglycerate-independent phosphoglycerate mutase [Verrucomicrobiota bacterium]